MCAMCGVDVLGKGRCSGCQRVYYCSREHQRQHWKTGGHRKVCKGSIGKDVVDIEAKGNVQAKIEDALSPDKRDHVRVFNILPYDFYDESTITSLCHRMINLTTIKVMDVKITKLHLTAELTPKLVDLGLRNVPNECDFHVVIPTLRNVSIHHYEPCRDALPINNMLAAATRLEKFETYKLWVSNELTFAGNNLKIINLHRSDCLRKITIWAPSLEHLGLQACYDIDCVILLRAHPILSKDLSKWHKPTNFTVNTRNCDISESALASLQESGRCTIEEDSDEDDFF